jgi:hypothetical protein
MDEQKQKLIERIGQAQNILVTVSANPSVDQLSAAIGFTLVLNQMDKHGTAVFSGAVPSTIEFLKPEETLEKTTDSLRDFIIALDKSKADKLRYKVEDEVVRIFITPYKTSLSEKDLEFSQGDFNVDVVVCLGVTEQEDLDKAITAHGRILHDATVVSISTTGQGSLGSINWIDPSASSLSEMMAILTENIDKKALNNQVATALLTGIVASTERFRGDNTTPKTMSVAAELMAAGANQQLIATELDTPPELPQTQVIDESARREPDADDQQPASERKAEPGTLEIKHDDEKLPDVADQPTSQPSGQPAAPTPKPVEPAVESASEPPESQPRFEMPDAETPEPERPQIRVSENGELTLPGQDQSAGQLPPPETIPEISHVRGVTANGLPTESDGHPAKTEVHRELLTTKQPQMETGDLTANTQPEPFDPPTEELTLPAVQEPLLSHNGNVLPPPLMPPTSVSPPLSSEPPVTFAPPQPVAAAPVMPAVPAPTMAPLSPPIPAPVAPLASNQGAVSATAPMQSAPQADNDTLSQIEQAVDSPHLHMTDGPGFGPAAPAPADDDDLSALGLTDSATPAPAAVPNPDDYIDSARDAVEAALSSAGGTDPLQPIAALNANPLGPDLRSAAAPAPLAAPAMPYAPPTDLFGPNPAAVPAPMPPAPAFPQPAVANTGFSEPTPGNTPADDALDMPLPAPAFGQPALPGTGLPSAPVAVAAPSAFPGAPIPGLGSQTPPPPVPPPMLPPLS